MFTLDPVTVTGSVWTVDGLPMEAERDPGIRRGLAARLVDKGWPRCVIERRAFR